MAHDMKSAGNGSATGSALHATPAIPRFDGAQQQEALDAILHRIHELARVLQQLGIDLVEQGDPEQEPQALQCRYLAEQIGYLAGVGIELNADELRPEAGLEWLLPPACLRLVGGMRSADKAPMATPGASA